MSYTLLVYAYAVGLIFICVLPEVQEQTVCVLPAVQEQIIVLELSLLQVHIITDLVMLPSQVHTPAAVALVTQIQVLIDETKAVHPQLSLPPPIVNETG